MTASNIVDEGKKLATLLHCGGINLQEIFYSIPDETENTTDKVYEQAIKKLNTYFKPQNNEIYEHYLFRIIKQEKGESFHKFLLRITNQAQKCKFKDQNEHIIDQIIEKCGMPDLRKKILIMKKEDININNIIATANALEAINRKIELSGKKEPINRLQTLQGLKKIKCIRCGGNHADNVKMCIARNKTCLKCGHIGHLKKCCRTKKKILRELKQNGKNGNRKYK